jgi:hypothetical protein
MFTAVEEIESAILKLSPKELGKLAEWVLDLDEQTWDKQIERDAMAGKLDFLAVEALAELKSGFDRVEIG